MDVDVNDDLKTIRFATVSSIQLYDFFFHRENGLAAFLRRHGTSIGAISELSLDSFLVEDREKFIKSCLAWKKFLFNDSGKPRSHDVTLTLDDQKHLPDFRGGASQFTVLYIDGLKLMESEDRLRLRFSGSRYKNAKVNWNIGDVSDVVISAENEETGKRASVCLSGGPLALLAYLYANGNKVNMFGDTIWRVEIKLPDPARATELHQENISIQTSSRWHDTFPDPIQWAK